MTFSIPMGVLVFHPHDGLLDVHHPHDGLLDVHHPHDGLVLDVLLLLGVVKLLSALWLLNVI